MVIDPTITYGALIEISIAVVGGVGFIYAMRSSIAVMGERANQVTVRMTDRIEQMGGRMADRIDQMSSRMGKVETEITKLSEVVVANARIEERIVAMKADNVTMRADVAAMALRMMAVESKQSVGHAERQTV